MYTKITLPAIIAIALAACTGSKAGNSAADSPFPTDSISAIDSVQVGDSKATVSIRGLYPAAGSTVADSVRQWLATTINLTSSYTGEMITPLSSSLINNGQKLIDTCADSLMTSATRDFVDLQANDFSTTYEYDVSFGISYLSPAIITYYCTAYGYQGGAHGGTSAQNASFRCSDGMILDYNNTFRPDGIADLIDLIREEIWVQYFEPDYPDGDMADALLINPLELELPATLPCFGPDGITFTYQQYEIAPYAAGMPSCTIPYDTLAPLMTPAIAQLVKPGK